MSAAIIDGKILAAQVKQEAAAAVRALQQWGKATPCLAVLLVGEDPASQVYVRGKESDCAACGIESRVCRLPETTTQAELLDRLAALAADLRAAFARPRAALRRSTHVVGSSQPSPAQLAC